MIFTVELSGTAERYRLQESGEWRDLDRNDSLKDGDFYTGDPAEVAIRTPYGKVIRIGEETYEVSPQTGVGANALCGSSMVFRKDFPNTPSKEQLRSVIAAGDDEQLNVLILNLGGEFELRQVPPFDHHKNDPTVVVRYESFAAEHGYVGVHAARDSHHIDSVFSACLQEWLRHLQTGRTQQYCEDFLFKSTEQMLVEIEFLKGRWTPSY